MQWPTPLWQKFKIGSGSFAGENKVLKKLHCKDWDTTGKKFIKEAKIMKELQHKNIVKFFAVCLNPFGILIEFCTFDFELLFDRWSSKYKYFIRF